MRRKRAKQHIILPDPKFNDVQVTKFVNNLMLSGKKTKAFDIFYSAIEIVDSKSEEEGLEVWKQALLNVTPGVEVRSRRVGGATFQIPTPVNDNRKQSMGMKWLIGYARKRNEKGMHNKLAAEILAAGKGRGCSLQEKRRYAQDG